MLFIITILILLKSIEATKYNIECHEERRYHCFAALKETKENGKILDTAKFAHIKVFYLQTNKTLDEIPRNLFTDFSDLIYVKINANIPKLLQTNQFLGANNVAHLNLAFNRFETLPSNVFAPLKNLKQLWLSLNRIQHFDGKMFDHLNELEYLDLSYNRLRAINAKSLSSMPKLTTLLLIGNQIEFIDDRAFDLKSIKAIVLDQNNLKTISPMAFSVPRSLEAISLADNSLEHIDFQLPDKLNYLNVGHNPLKQQIDMKKFTKYRNLNVLLLANVSSDIVFSNDRDKLTVTRLNLSYNDKLSGETVLSKLQNSFPNLEHLNLEGNDFKTLVGLKNIQRTFPKLNELYIGCNSFECKWLKDQIKDLKFNFELFSCSQPIERRHQTKQIETIDCV